MSNLHFEPALPQGLLAALLAACALALALRAIRPPVLWSLGAGALRLAALAIAATAVLRPSAVRLDEHELRPRLAVLLDASRSMALPDARGGPTRAERMAALLTREAVALDHIERAYEVSWFAFGEDMRPSARTAPAPTHSATALGDAFDAAAALPGTGPLGGVLILSDGTATAGGSVEAAAERLKKRGVPLWCLAFVGSESAPNVSVADLAAPECARLGQAVTVAVRIRLRGEKPARLRVRAHLNGLLADGTEVSLDPDEDRTVRLRLHPREARLHRVRVTVDPIEGEVHLSDNARETAFAVERGRLRAVHLMGALSWDTRAVRRALALLPNAEVLEGRGFVRETAEAESRACLSDAALAAHPLVVVLGEGSGRLVTPERAARIAAAVQLEGAGLLVLAGDGSAAALSGSALELLMPTRLALTRREEAVEALALPSAEGDIWRVLPASARAGARLRFELVKANPIPGARTLLAAGEAGPALLVREAGKGRVAVLLARDYGHWRESPAVLARLCRWLAGDKPGAAAERLALRLSRWRLAPGDRLEVTAAVQASAAEARFRLTLIDPDGGEHSLRAEPMGPAGDAAPQRWRAVAWPAEPGAWRVRAELSEPDRAPEKAEAAFAVEASDAETAEPRPSPETLERLARLTGGRSVREDEAAALLAAVASSAPRPELTRIESRRSTWDRWPLLALALLTLCAAWLLDAPRARHGSLEEPRNP